MERNNGLPNELGDDSVWKHAQQVAGNRAAAVSMQGTVVASLVACNYTWDAQHTHAEYLTTGRYRVENNAVTGLKIFGSTLFLTVPRWRPGVPSTLNTLLLHSASGSPLLAPWPSWDWQEENDCSRLQYVQSMEISDGVMWVVDVGRRNFIGFSSDNTCPPKMMLFDVRTGVLLEVFVFPDAAASYTQSFLNDIVIDAVRQRAYISDAGSGALVVFDRRSRQAWRFADATTRNNPAYSFVIEGVDYGNATFTTPADGIALLPDASRVVYCALQGVDLWSVDAAVLGDPLSTHDEVKATQRLLGRKASASDGLAFDCAATLWFGGLTTSTVNAWPFAAAGGVDSAAAVRQDGATLQWPDTFAFDERGGLYVTTNRLDRFFSYTMDFNGADANFRVVKFESGTASYLADCPPSLVAPSEPTDGGGSGTRVTELALLAVAVGLLVVLGAALGGALWLTLRVQRGRGLDRSLEGLAIKDESQSGEARNHL